MANNSLDIPREHPYRHYIKDGYYYNISTQSENLPTLF